MQACFRRLYSSIPDAAAAARIASTPRAVRIRRLRRQPASAAQPEVSPVGATPTELARYKRGLAKGELVGEDNKYLTEAEWLEKLNDRRRRVRGAREVVKHGKKEVAVVGQKIYLPNLVFRLVRNHTPAGQPYNPYEATFRIPNSVTKTDVRSYLSAVYGVKTTYIRTDNYIAPMLAPHRLHAQNVQKPTYRTYKRAVVGLVDPFYYPQAMEDMSSAERKEREGWLEEHFQVKQMKEDIKMTLFRLTRQKSKGWKWRTGTTAQRGNILRLIAERRATREAAVADVKARMTDARESAS